MEKNQRILIIHACFLIIWMWILQACVSTIASSTSAEVAFYCKANTTCYACGKRSYTVEKTNLLLYNKVGLAANKSKEGGLSNERHK